MICTLRRRVLAAARVWAGASPSRSGAAGLAARPETLWRGTLADAPSRAMRDGARPAAAAAPASCRRRLPSHHRRGLAPSRAAAPARPDAATTAPMPPRGVQDYPLQPLVDDCRLLGSLLDDCLRIEVGDELFKKVRGG